MTTRSSRREFLRGRLSGGQLPTPEKPTPARSLPRVIAWLDEPAEPAAAPSERHASFPMLRPPGAISEPQFLAGCTRCDACIGACPHGALQPAPARYRDAAGTPIIDPAQAPCRLCENWPCISACPEGVLVLEGAGAMGSARIQAHDCLNALGTQCSVCLERCPIEGALQLQAGKVTVHVSLCTGCGICHHVCPAPNNAVIILPARERPERPASPVTPTIPETSDG